MSSGKIQLVIVFPTVFAGANFLQIGVGVDPLGMSIIPVELDGIMADGSDFCGHDRTLAEEWKGIGLGFDQRRSITAYSTGASPAEIGVGISSGMFFTPPDEYSSGSR